MKKQNKNKNWDSTFCTARIRDKQNAFRYPLQEGWSYIETLIVIGIIVILMAVVAITSTGSLQKARVAGARTQIDSFCTALEAYCIDCGFYPTQSQGLEALRRKPSSSPVSEHWSGPYISKSVPKDPWGNEYVYVTPSPDGDPYGIICYGADGMEGGTGANADITSWGD